MEYSFGKDEILVKLRFKDLNYHKFHIFFVITNFKTDGYLNNFQEHLFGLLGLRKYKTLLQIFFPRENEAVKPDLVEFKVQYLTVFCYHGNKPTILLFTSNFRTTAEVSSKLYFEIS